MGFHISNPMARTILTPEEIENEYKAIKKLGPFENLLIVTGEFMAKIALEYMQMMGITDTHRLPPMSIHTMRVRDLTVPRTRKPKPAICRMRLISV